MRKGAAAWKNENRNRELHALDGGCGQFTRHIGSTTYLVTVRFSGKGKETLEDKILRLIEKEAEENCLTPYVPQRRR